MEVKTVRQVVDSYALSKIWLCPDHVPVSPFKVIPLLRGLDCTNTTVPPELEEMRVTKVFFEDNTLCIIWKNDGRFYPLIQTSITFNSN